MRYPGIAVCVDATITALRRFYKSRRHGAVGRAREDVSGAARLFQDVKFLPRLNFLGPIAMLHE
jgi:hypothetical protein